MPITRLKPRSSVYHDEEDDCKTAKKLIAANNFVIIKKGAGKRTQCDRCGHAKTRRIKAAKASKS